MLVKKSIVVLVEKITKILQLQHILMSFYSTDLERAHHLRQRQCLKGRVSEEVVLVSLEEDSKSVVKMGHICN